MHQPSRARNIFKWFGVGLSLSLLAAWIVSLWTIVVYGQYGEAEFRLMGGEFVVEVYVPKFQFGAGYWRVFDATPKDAGFLGFGLCLPYFGTRYSPGNSLIYQSFTSYEARVPLWLMLAAISLLTWIAWHRDHRRISSPLDHPLCASCGYDLTGNFSGVCSECGSTMPRTGRV